MPGFTDKMRTSFDTVGKSLRSTFGKDETAANGNGNIENVVNTVANDQVTSDNNETKTEENVENKENGTVQENGDSNHTEENGDIEVTNENGLTPTTDNDVPSMTNGTNAVVEVTSIAIPLCCYSLYTINFEQYNKSGEAIQTAIIGKVPYLEIVKEFMELEKDKILPGQIMRDIGVPIKKALYGLLYPNSNADNWDGLSMALAEGGVHQFHDLFWSTYGKLIDQRKEIDIAFLNLPNDLLNPHDLAQDYEDISDKIDKIYPVLFHRFIGFQVLDDVHLYLILIDLEKQYTYHIDSVPLLSFPLKTWVLKSIGKTIHKTLTAISSEKFERLTNENPYGARLKNISLDDFIGWDHYKMREEQQERARGCGFFLLLNIKYITNKIIPKFHDDDSYMLRYMLLYEVLRNRLFPILVEV
ncbi:hypothetical protein SNEBB_009482 [Seison nebaliae]|nr:hypothetical protein SNEBB_009482 [Seison nebaliae]